MNGSRSLAAVWRLIVVILCFYQAPIVVGQSPLTRTQTKPEVKQTIGVNQAQIGSSRLPTVPQLFGMNRTEVVRVLEPLRLQPKFSGPDNGVAVGQEPAAGKVVRYGSGVVVTLGEMPRLVLSGPAASAYAGKELTFTASFEPPLPEGLKVTYFFTWGDGSATESTGNAVGTHHFADAGRRVVSVVWAMNDRVKIGRASVLVNILPLPTQTETTPTATDATTSDTTATVATEGSAVTETTTTTQPTTTTESTTSSATTGLTTATESTTATIPITTTGTTGGGTSSNLLVWIGAAAVVLLLVVTFLLARVLRALNRKGPQVQAKSPVAFNGGMRSVEYEIEHPELIRRMPEVALRGGIRGEGDGDV